jgi:cell division protein FtsQ
LPNHIVLVIEEHESIAYLESDGSYLPILESGQVLKDRKENVPADAPLLINWKKEEDIKEMISELKKLSPGIFNSISEIHHTPTKTDPWLVRLYMNDGFEVIATVRTFSKKMDSYPAIISQLDNHDTGVIHLEVGSYFEAVDTIETKGEQNEDENEIEG